jgi:hypothetical protein
MKSLALAVLPWLGLTACTGDVEPPTSVEQGLSLSTYSDKLVVGAYDDHVVHVDLESRATSDGVVVTTMTMDQLVFTLTVDYGSGEIDYANPSVSPNREQIAALRALEGELAFMTAEDKSITEVESTLVALATFVSDAAAGEVLPSIRTSMNRVIANIGGGNSCRTLYGGSCSPYKQTGRDSDNCKGRCGAGCNTAHTGGNNKWTMDCAEHDYGIGPLGDCADDSVSGTNYYTSGGSCFWATNCNSADGCSSSAGGHGPYCRN